VTLIGLVLPVGAFAAPMHYSLVAGEITTLFINNVAIDNNLALDSSLISVDFAVGTDGVLTAFNMAINGPLTFDLAALGAGNPVPTTDSVTISNATSSLVGSNFPLNPLDVNRFSFLAPAQVESDVLIETSASHPFLPNQTIPQHILNSTLLFGELEFAGSLAMVTFQGFDFGTIIDPTTAQAISLKADIFLTAAIPEPGAFLVFAIGLIVVAARYAVRPSNVAVSR